MHRSLIPGLFLVALCVIGSGRRTDPALPDPGDDDAGDDDAADDDASDDDGGDDDVGDDDSGDDDTEDDIREMGLCDLPEPCPDGDCIAFPGAEGEGRYAEGGRGGEVVHVTNLDDSGAGSFREAVSGSGAPRTVVFDIGGIIEIDSPLKSDRDHLTIAGQTAPGEGITFKDYQVELTGGDLIVQHVHFRAGDEEKKTANNTDGYTEDSFTFGGDDVIIDHVSASWGIDEVLSANGYFDRCTVQWSIIAEGLHASGLFHGELGTPPGNDGHSMGGMYKSHESGTSVSVHHNLYLSNGNRNPCVGNYDTDESIDADIRNNVLYNNRENGYVSGVSGGVRINYVGNYGIRGPSSEDDELFRGNEDSNVEIYADDNLTDLQPNGIFNGVDLGWSAILDDYTVRNSPVAMEPVTTDAASATPMLVATYAGAFPWDRDAVDQRLIAELLSAGNDGEIIDSVSEVGGQPSTDPGTPVVDSDGDGMPDSFESAYGTNPSQADHNADLDGDGWSNLEAYLYWAANHLMP